jgi:hypothetical protein
MDEMAGRKLLFRDSLRVRVSACEEFCSDIVCFVAMKQKDQAARRDSFIAFTGPSAADKALDLGLSGPVDHRDQDTAFKPEGTILKSTGAEPLYVAIWADGNIVVIGGIFNNGTDMENLNLAHYLPN